VEINKKTILEQIALAKEGRQSAFNYLLDLYWNNIYGFQLRRIGNEHDAEDITIETFSKAFDKIDTFDEKYNFGTWLTTISKNIQIDKSRKKKTSVLSQTTDTSPEQIKKIADKNPSPEDKLITEQNLAELLQYIKKLSTNYQEIINLRYFQEMSYNEISEVLKEPLSTVKVRLLRARKLLSEIITQNRVS